MAAKKKKKAEEDADEGFSLDDAFDDDDDVEYAETKPKQVKKKETVKKHSQKDDDSDVVLKGSKQISKITKGDVVKVDGISLEVDSQYVMIDHGNTKEMAIELFDSKTDKDYQLRYFDDNIENSIEFFELEEIIYSRKPVKKIEW